MENREVYVINILTKYMNDLIIDGLDIKTICDMVLSHNLRPELKIGGTLVTDAFIIDYIKSVISV